MAVAVKETHPLELVQALRRVTLQFLPGNLELRLQRTHDGFQSESLFARFDRYPDTRGNCVQAVTQAFLNIEKYCTLVGICGTHICRDTPSNVVIIHVLPPGWTFQ